MNGRADRPPLIQISQTLSNDPPRFAAGRHSRALPTHGNGSIRAAT